MSKLIDAQRDSIAPEVSSAEPLRDGKPDYLERLAAFSERIPSLSPTAFAIGLACLGVASAFRFVAGWSLSDLRYVTYLPAILATGLLAGTPAAVAVMIGSIVIVVWAFIPPYFAFKWLDPAQLTTVLWTVFASLCTIFFAHGCRTVLRQLRAREASNRVLLQELAHRGRNIFAVIEIVSQKTLADDPEHANALLGRLRAIRYANELLIGAAHQSVDLRALLLQEFAPYGEKQVDARGAQVEVEPEAARHLILLFHELVTNAAKYGALSSSEGRVIVRWHQNDSGLVLTWKEIGGPEVVPPQSQGFGSQLIGMCVRALSGTFEPEYLPEGFACSMSFSTPLAGVRQLPLEQRDGPNLGRDLPLSERRTLQASQSGRSESKALGAEAGEF
jgi:two-component sensor histidine kinase